MTDIERIQEEWSKKLDPEHSEVDAAIARLLAIPDQPKLRDFYVVTQGAALLREADENITEDNESE